MKLFNDEQAEYFKSHMKMKGHVELAEMMNSRFGLRVTRQQIKSYIHNHGLNTGLTGHFNKGRVPANKGKHQKVTGNMAKNWFKKGVQARNHKPVGTTVVRHGKRTQVYIKVAEPSVWRSKNRVIWEEAYGPIPEGKVLVFADGDPLNVTLDNLILATRRQMQVMNEKHLIQPERSLTLVGLQVANLSIKVADKKKKLRKG